MKNIKEQIANYLLQVGFKQIGKTSFHRRRHNSVSIVFHPTTFTYSMVESGGIKEGWENKTFRFTKTAFKTLQQKLVWD